jgi:hypothetical protein
MLATYLSYYTVNRYDIMSKCWNTDSQQRPTFAQLVQWINEIINSVRPGSRISTALYQNVHGKANPSQSSDKSQPSNGHVYSPEPGMAHGSHSSSERPTSSDSNAPLLLPTPA